MRQEAERQRRAGARRSNSRGSQQQADQLYNDTLRQQQSRAAGDMAQAEAVRRSWQQRPPLAPERNPLLGRWESLGSGQRKGGAAGLSPEMANLANALIGGLTGGLCDSMLGRGTIEFRPAGLLAIGRDGRERPMYRAEYRGGGSRVVVLPQGGTTFTHMIIDFSGPDHATVAAVGCGLARAGAAAARRRRWRTPPSRRQTGAAPANGRCWEARPRTAAWTSTSRPRRSAGRATRRGWSNLYDFKTRQVFEGRPLLSARNEFEYDCTRARQRMLATTGFSGHMGQGTVVGSSDGAGTWEPVGTSGPFYEHWKVACTRK